METSLFIARTLAIAYLSFGLGLLLNRSYYEKEIPKILENTTLQLYGGFFATVFGATLIHFHPHWETNWTAIITAFGWLGLIKGVSLLVFPRSVQFYKNTLFHEKRLFKIMTPLVFLMGLVLAYFGFMLHPIG